MRAREYPKRGLALGFFGALTTICLASCGTSGPVLSSRDGGQDGRRDRMGTDAGSPPQDAATGDAGLADGSLDHAGDGGSVDARGDAGETPACDMLERTMWSGPTPFDGDDLTARVEVFWSGDCFTRSQASAILRNDAGDELAIRFSYPVTADDEDHRSVEGTFEREARIDWTPASGSRMEMVGTILVEVTRWVEHRDDAAGHEVDLTIRVDEPGFGSDPVVVRGRYCEWFLHVC